MAKRRKKRPLRPRVPSRVKKRTRKGGVRSAQHHELVGLGLLALGVFLASMLYLGWSGGMVGGAIADGFKGAIGAAAYVAPVAFVVIGALMVARSALVDVRPFRTGLIVTAFGLLAALGASHGGAIGRGLEQLFGLLVGSTGTLIIGVLALVTGTLLLSGASAGALVRRSGHAVKRAHTRARRALPTEPGARPAPVIPIRTTPPVDAVHDYPDVVSENHPPPLLVEPRTEDPDQPSLFDVGSAETHEEYDLPDRNVLRRSPAASELSSDVAERTASALVQTLAHFGVDATIVGQISGPRVTRYELQLAPGTKVSKVAALKDDLSYALATTEIRILAPIPGKQAVGVEVPDLSPNLVTLGEMERRYEKLSVVRARNLAEANRTLRQRGEQTMPYLLVVIDELADLMMISPQNVEDAVIRLAQKSRAVGIHLVLATQRPSVDVITGMIKANVPSRIAFAVSSQTDSRVVLDQSGAESLLGQGDMLFKPLGTSRLQRVQGAYVSEEEIALIVDQCRHQRDQELDESLLELPEVFAEDVDADDGEFDPDEDPLLEKAIEIVVQTQTASVSLLQRRLRVGYTRAGRLIDMLERRGIISGYEGSKPRRVLHSESEQIVS